MIKRVRRDAPGVDYHHRHFSNPFGDGPLSVHYLVITWDKTPEGFTFAYANCGGKRKRTSWMAMEHQALAAVNDGYHRTKNPPLPYHPMKLDGVVLDSVSPSGGQLALAFDRGHMPIIVPIRKRS